jgi:O-antigen ligase
MTRIEKLTVAILVISATTSAALFGVWEDKFTLYAPLLAMVYIAFAMWVSGVGCRVSGGKWKGTGVTSQGSDGSSVGRKPFSSFIFHFSSSQTPPGGVWLLIFFLYSLALIPFSVLPYEAEIATLRFGCYLGTYWAAANILSRFSYRKAVWTVVFTALVLVALYSLVQHKVAPNLIFGMERYTDSWTEGRLGGTYQCPNHIAHLFQMGMPFCLVFLFIPQFGWFWRICFAYAIPLFGLLIYQTQSRAGILGAMAAVPTTVLFMILRKSRKAFLIALLVVPLLGAGALGALWAGSSMFRTRMQPVMKGISLAVAGDWERMVSLDFRPMTWVDTVVMIKERPVFGFGPGNYALTYEDYRTRVQALRIITVHAHNEYLELVAEYGLVGGLLFLLALISLVVQLIRFIRTSPRSYHALPAAALLGTLAGTAVHGFFDFELHNFPNAMMLALLAGCAVAPLVQLQRDEHEQRKKKDGHKKHENSPKGG